MFERLKQRWRRLCAAPPGERFTRRYRAQHVAGQHRPMLRRVLLLGLAVLLTAIGVVLMFIPGPAILFFFLAGALLAEESLPVARGLDWAELRLRAAWNALRRWWSRRSKSAGARLLVAAGLLASVLPPLSPRPFG